ncbi:bacteriocin [Dolichospermum circinale]|jgi:bacteriocin-like protein|nr:bacteriocin [Dolichospermum circinale]MDB9450621.1 bacteriocin [Dolichospermum circinale CS-547]
MANIQIADLAQVENQFDKLSDLELEAIIGGKVTISIFWGLLTISWD